MFEKARKNIKKYGTDNQIFRIFLEKSAIFFDILLQFYTIFALSLPL